MALPRLQHLPERRAGRTVPRAATLRPPPASPARLEGLLGLQRQQPRAPPLGARSWRHTARELPPRCPTPRWQTQAGPGDLLSSISEGLAGPLPAEAWGAPGPAPRAGAVGTAPGSVLQQAKAVARVPCPPLGLPPAVPSCARRRRRDPEAAQPQARGSSPPSQGPCSPSTFTQKRPSDGGFQTTPQACEQRPSDTE
ncbi:homeobox protein CDX-1-like [Phyllostomus hastatus]|uniref:homeobox protein CDX-1-like n=1 Tax=Phyllostomus hastatus TaxID=9423 RepID=UPI001E67E0EA|nr:homeobox protein CDX-1-like [Phyllostomus hastatus]